MANLLPEDLPEQGSKEAAQLFVSLYRLKFGPLSAERNEGEWAFWRKQIDLCEPRHFDALIGHMAVGRRDAKEKPKIEALMTARHVVENERSTRPRGGPCAMCGGTGLFSVPCRMREDRTWAFEHEPGAKKPLTMVSWPCNCAAGEYGRHKGGYDLAAHKAAVDLMKTAMRACGIAEGEEERPISLADFLATHKGDRVLSVARLFGDEIAASNRAVRGDPPEQEAELQPSRTLAYLRALRSGKRPPASESPGGITLADIPEALSAPAPTPEDDDYERREREAIQKENEPW